MKKKALSLLLIANLTCAMTAQTTYSVKTDVQKKKVMLEEFTGIHCGWCPEGHQTAAIMLNAQGENAYVVAIHCGSYSVPSSKEPDYRTELGDSIHKFIGTTSYPTGTTNRNDFGRGTIITGRSRWVSDAELIRKQDAPVNLYVKSTYDGNTNILSVHVEGYYTGKPTAGTTQALNVIFTQDDIVGPQGGVGSNYVHKHMLRGALTPIYGDTLVDVKKGDYFTRDYQMELPADIRSITLKPEDIKVLAFVTEDYVNVLNVEGGRPVFSNYNTTESGYISEPNLPVGTRYGYNFFEGFLKNTSSKDITSASFDVTVNGVTTPATINCKISQFETAAFRVPAVISYAEKGNTSYEVKLTAMNGVPVEGNSLTGKFQKPVVTDLTVNAEIMTDDHATQNLFVLYDADGNVVTEFGPYPEWTATTYNETMSLEDGKTYCLEIYDMWGDGMTEGGKGGLITHTGWGKLIDQYYTVTGFGVRSFFTADVAADINGVNTDSNEGIKTYYSIDGRKVTGTPAPGIYIVKSAKGTHKEIIK